MLCVGEYSKRPLTNLRTESSAGRTTKVPQPMVGYCINGIWFQLFIYSGDRNQGANSDRDTNSDSNRVRRNDANRAYAGYHAGERHTYPELFKWGIKYDDTAKTMLVEDFIFRVEKLQRSYNCPWEVIMDGFHHLLEGQAAK
ncbi:hypothetical protein EVAR_101098_1 [Eumeta japonica]|uniref:Uncharacterized protein n=1 Tax=Eumeta variegata TaxID=151549 RepID=A0A4C1TGA5_EUMVA|nr:hypothetical protein EVAR_101098_1 [Eumeta japonica]